MKTVCDIWHSFAFHREAAAVDDLEAQWLSLVMIFGQGRFQKNFEAKLVGADKTKDLAVLDVCYFPLWQGHCYCITVSYEMV